MMSKLFNEGGPYNIRKAGQDEYTMSISLPTDEDGRRAHECPDESCSPGYFKVMPGTGITGGQESIFCPYCRKEEAPDKFFTEEQIRFAKDIAIREAHDGMERILKEALGLGASGRKKIEGGLFSVEMSLTPSHRPMVRRPFEEEVRRDVICPHCGLNQSVYGLAIWCSDCGKDIFLTHVQAELFVVKSMLADVERRRETLGNRVAAKDLENCLEDTVSIFEAVLKAIVRRFMSNNGNSREDIDKFFKKIGNAFQNIKKSEDVFLTSLNLVLFDALQKNDIDLFESIFEKRHPITHNLGVIDKKYIEKARTAEKEGKEVYVSAQEVEQSITFSLQTFQSLHKRMF